MDRGGLSCIRQLTQFPALFSCLVMLWTKPESGIMKKKAMITPQCNI